MLAQGQTDVLENGHRVKQCPVLKEHSYPFADFSEIALTQSREIVPGNTNDSGIRTLQPTDHAQQSRLTRTAATKQKMDSTLPHMTFEALVNGTMSKGQLHIANGDELFVARGAFGCGCQDGTSEVSRECAALEWPLK